MNKRILAITMIFATGLIFSSCEKDKLVPKPEITNFELGYENTGTAYLGSDLHMEAEIVAEGKIDKIVVEIHPEGDHAKSTRIMLHEVEWAVDTTYTKFSGLKNTTFHEHIDIPFDTETGFYHFHFSITDMEGQQTTMEEVLEIKAPEDAVAPVINITLAPDHNQVFNGGATITISGTISDNKALGGMYIGLVREGQNLTDAEVNADNTITVMHTHDFDTPESHSFTASILVGAAKDNNIIPKDITGDIAWQSANYYILIKCTDAFGGNWTFSNHYPIVINL